MYAVWLPQHSCHYTHSQCLRLANQVSGALNSASTSISHRVCFYYYCPAGAMPRAEARYMHPRSWEVANKTLRFLVLSAAQ